MARASNSTTILALAQDILEQVSRLDNDLKQSSISQPCLAVGASTELWTSHSTDIESARSSILGLTKKLTKLLVGPHEFLHEYISLNWEHGALYTLLEFDILEKIPLDGQAHVSSLASQSGLPEKKLLSVLRLVSCEGILDEVSEGVFAHTAISEELVRDEKFKAFIGFQLFETRIASAHLADSMKVKASDYQTGQSAFKYAWGASMYDWHKTHPEKAIRFGKAMAGVTQSLDPGNALLYDWLKSNQNGDHFSVVDVEGRNTAFLADQFPALSVQTPVDNCMPQPTGDLDDKQMVYLIRNTLWNCSDEEGIKTLQTFVPAMEKSPNTVLLVNEMMSPAAGTFEPHIEKSYRRRDVTVMTMHNAKQRTEGEWKELFAKASLNFTLNVRTAATSHSYRGLWEVRWRQPDDFRKGEFTNGNGFLNLN